MSVGRHSTFWQRLWPGVPASPARIVTDCSTIRLEIQTDALRQLALTEPAAAALLEAFAPTNHGDWGGPDYPAVSLDVEQLRRLLGLLTVATRT